MEDTWIGAAIQYLEGDDWRSNFESFVDSHLYKFATEAKGGEYEHRQHEVWQSFRNMTDQSLESVLCSIGGSGDALLTVCKGRLDDRNVQKLLHQLDTFDSFFEFTEMMVERNQAQQRGMQSAQCIAGNLESASEGNLRSGEYVETAKNTEYGSYDEVAAGYEAFGEYSIGDWEYEDVSADSSWYPWEQYYDDSGAPYWWNSQTGHSTYDEPAADDGGAEGLSTLQEEGTSSATEQKGAEGWGGKEEEGTEEKEEGKEEEGEEGKEEEGGKRKEEEGKAEEGKAEERKDGNVPPRALDETSVLSWSADDVITFLKQTPELDVVWLTKELSTSSFADVDGEALLQLDAADLVAKGVERYHTVKVMRLIAQLRAKCGANAPAAAATGIGGRGGGASKTMHNSAPPFLSHSRPSMSFGKVEYRKGEQVIGRGAFGEVFVALDQVTGAMMAVKEIRLGGLQQLEVQAIRTEIRLMTKLHHPNIVHYLGTRLVLPPPELILQIVTEWVPGGSLKSILRRFGRLSHGVTRNYCRQTLEGLVYLHENRIIHRYTMHSLVHSPLIHSPLVHSSHTILSYNPLIHSSHPLLSSTPLIHSSHPLLSSTPLAHSSPQGH
jgi:hypothetical protein